MSEYDSTWRGQRGRLLHSSPYTRFPLFALSSVRGNVCEKVNAEVEQTTVMNEKSTGYKGRAASCAAVVLVEQ